MPSVLHKFVSPVANGGNANLVQPSNWNDGHTLSYTKRTVTSSTDTLGATDDIVFVNYAGAVAASVDPASITAGKEYCYKDISGAAATNNITVTPSSGTIDGASSAAIGSNYGAIKFISDGTNLYVTG